MKQVQIEAGSPVIIPSCEQIPVKHVPNSAGLKVIKLKPVASNNDQTSFGHERKKLMDIDAKKVAYEKQHKDKIFQMIK